MADRIPTDEAAALIQVKTTQLQNWRQRNFGPPYFKVGGIIFYDRDELLQWFKATRCEPQKQKFKEKGHRKVANRKTDAHATG